MRQRADGFLVFRWSLSVVYGVSLFLLAPWAVSGAQNLSVTWSRPPPLQLTTGQTFRVEWLSTGAPDDMHVHWHPVDPTAPFGPIPNSTADVSVLNHDGFALLTAPMVHENGLPISCPTVVRYAVHVASTSEVLASNYSSVVQITVQPRQMLGYPDVILDYFDSGLAGIPGPFGRYDVTVGSGPVPVSLDVVLGADPCPHTNFLSLPTGSFVTVGFTDESITNGPEADFFIEEIGDVEEIAEVYVSPNYTDFFFAGIAHAGGRTPFDLSQINAGAESIVALRLVGFSLDGISPGFDFAGVEISPTSIGPPGLKPRPQTPLVVPTIRMPAPNLTQLLRPSNTQLKVFADGVFTTTTNVDASRMTIVLTHGWNSNVRDWPTTMAAQLVAGSIRANILAWDWGEASLTLNNLDLALSRTCRQGESLGIALYQALGRGYTRELHFIGHSLGTLVNRSAADYLHGDAARKPSIPYDWNKTHVTLLDEAEITAPLGDMSMRGGAGASHLKEPCFGQSIPTRCAWVDNYFSLGGSCHGDAVNIFLPQGYDSEPSDWHAYPHQWYAQTILAPRESEMGHRWSFERDGVLPVAYPPGTLLLQSDWPTSAFSLAKASDEERRQVCNERSLSLFTERRWFLTTLAMAGTTPNVATELSVAYYSAWTNIADAQAGRTAQRLLDWTYRLKLRKGAAALSASPIFVPAAQPSNAPAPAHAWATLAIPSDVVGLSLQCQFVGVDDEDFLSIGINQTPLMMLESRFVPHNQWFNTGVLNLSPWAGQTVELFLGYAGASTNTGTIAVQAMQFHTLLGPTLNISGAAEQSVLAWPANAIGFQVESTHTLSEVTSWLPLLETPSVHLNQLLVTNLVSQPTRFYRLRRP